LSIIWNICPGHAAGSASFCENQAPTANSRGALKRFVMSSDRSDVTRLITKNQYFGMRLQYFRRIVVISAK
jgi:hypothetical protein